MGYDTANSKLSRIRFNYITLNELMRKDGVFCLEYDCSNTLLFGYIRKPFLFPLKLSIPHDNWVDCFCKVKWNIYKWYLIFLAWLFQNSENLVSIFIPMAMYVRRFNKNLSFLLLWHNLNHEVCNQDLAWSVIFENDAHLIRYDQILLRN